MDRFDTSENQENCRVKMEIQRIDADKGWIICSIKNLSTDGYWLSSGSRADTGWTAELWTDTGLTPVSGYWLNSNIETNTCWTQVLGRILVTDIE